MIEPISRHILSRYPPGVIVEHLDGQDVRALFHAAYAWLERHYEIVNQMNVFPVPDGDTGTNMLLTVKRAWEEIAQEEDAHAGHIISRIAHGALMGARGNSGVILSQVLRGMSRRLEQEPKIDSSALAEGLQEGSKTAYRGVSKPVEGTILTVVRETAEAAVAAARLEQDLRFLFERTLQAAQNALERTPELLPVLKQAGVVDSGGMGFCYIWEGMTRSLRGEIIDRMGSVQTNTGEPNLGEMPDEWGYDVQFLVYANHVTEEDVRRHLESLGGESIVVGRVGDVIKVHVHGPDPGPFLSYGASLGELDDVVVENMTLQTLRRKGKLNETTANVAGTHTQGVEKATSRPAEALTGTNKVAVVAVSPGPGFDEVLQSLGVDRVVKGGQTMNPSTAEILQAIDEVPQNSVIILPNNKNVLLAAQQAAELSSKEVRVVPSRTVPEGIAAMLAFDPDGDVNENYEQMKDALNNVHTASITKAVNNADFDHIRVEEGDVIGIIDGVLRAKGADLQEVVLKVLQEINAQDFEIITIYYGQDVNPADAEALAETVRRQYPEQEVELIYGGQPYYPYIISVE